MRSKGIWQKAIQRLLCGIICLTLAFSLLPMGAVAAEEPSAAATQHHEEASFNRVLIPATALSSESGWTKTKGPANITFSDGSVTFQGAGDNHIAWNEKIEADRFLISMDVTVNGEATATEDLKVEFFKANAANSGQRAIVRFKFDTSTIKIGSLTTDNTGSNCTEDQSLLNSVGFTWTTGTPMAIDILVDKTANKINVYVDGDLKGMSTGDLSAFEQGYFSIGGQYPNQNFSVSNLTVTTDEEKADPTPDPTDPPATTNHIDPLAVTIGNTSFTEANWTLTRASNASDATELKLENGALIIKGSGADNRADWNGGKIQADKFLIQMDVTSGSASANDLKIEFFKEQEGATGNRAQVRFKFGEKVIKIASVSASNTDSNNLNGANQPFDWASGAPVAIDILVDKAANTITVYVDGVEKAQSTTGLDVFYQGYFGISGQYGTQDLKIENLKISAEKLLSEEVNKTALAQTVENAKTTYTDSSVYTPESWAVYMQALAEAEAELASTASTDATVQAALDKLNEAITGLAPADPDAGKPKHIDPLTGTVRTLAEDSFQDGGNWTTSGSLVTIGDGKARIAGAGPDNYMVWAAGPINADTFLISLDLTFNEGNTNGATKIAFMGESATGTERMQIRLVRAPGSGNQNWLGIQKGDGATTATCAASSNYPWEAEKTYGIDIEVTEDAITLYVDAVQVATVSKTALDWSSLGRGWFSIRSQYPNQDYTIENLSITTNEEREGAPIPFTLAEVEGGTVTVLSGAEWNAGERKWYAYPGDMVMLSATADHGYVFDRYTTNTDGLVTIPVNGRFTMETPKNDSELAISAVFSERQGGRFELWYDDFGYETLNDPSHPKHNNGSWNDNHYDITAGQESNMNLVDGALQLGTSSTTYLQIPEDIAAQLDGKSYRITVDAWQAAGSGTMQIMFNGKGATPAERFANRTVVIVNGNVVLFKSFDSGAGGTELAKVTYTFGPTPVTLMLEVIGDTVTLYSNGTKLTSYTSTDSWGGRTPAVGLINMTPALTVCFDNFTVEVIPDIVNISVETTVNGEADPDLMAGTARISASTAVAGDKITLTATAKAGYEIAGITAKAPYADSIDVTKNEDDTWSFTVPDDASEEIVLVVDFTEAEPEAPRTYYIDSVGGSDSNPGTIEQPWQSLIPLQSTVLNPGDTVYLKRGSQFNAQQLIFLGSGGTEQDRITITAYGEGDSLPQLNGQGELTNVVELWNQPYVTIEKLEITNLDPTYGVGEFVMKSARNNSKTLRAINVYAKDYGVVSGIYIRDCYIHDVNGTLGGKWNGGIFFDIQGTTIPTKYDGCIIENNTIINVNRSAIKLVSSSWCNQSMTNNPGAFLNWYPSTNMVVRGNYMEYIGGDGITVRDVDGTLVEHNLAKDCNYQANCPANPASMYNVGIWPFEASNTVLQYNEAYNTHSVLDGQGLDCDHLSSNSVMQYNYSHNNEGGFMLIMGQWEHTSVTIRYNISQNDKDKTFEFTRGVPKGTAIYNNTIYSDTVLNRGILWRPNNTGSSVGNNEVYLFNNLFIFPAGQTMYGGANDGCKTDMQNAAKLYNNGYVGFTAPDADKNPITAATAAEVLVAAGTAPTGSSATTVARTGASGLLDGYQLTDSSPMIDRGVTVEAALQYFNGGTAPTMIDIKALSPLDAFKDAYTAGIGSTGTSVQYVNTDPIALPGVSYDADFFGNSNLAGSAPDIGAAEYAGSCLHLSVEHVEATEATCEEDGNVEYYKCSTCGAVLVTSDDGSYIEVDPEDVVIPAGHVLTHVEAREATCTGDGSIEYWNCSNCGKRFTDAKGEQQIDPADTVLPKLSHEYSEKWEYNETGHWHKCTACGAVSGKTEHTYGAWQVTKEATADAAGIRERSCSVCGYTETETIPTVEPEEPTEPQEPSTGGSVEHKVESGKGAPGATISMDQDALLDAVLTEDEKALVEAGSTDVKIILHVENATNTVSASDKAAVEDALEKRSVLKNYTLGIYLDLTLEKLINDESTFVTQTNGNLRITLEVPEALRGKDREFKVIRVHNGSVTVLADLDNASNTITIETDRFSTYAIVYSTKTTNSSNSPQTGDSYQSFWIVSVMLSIAGITVISWEPLVGRRKRRK